MLSLHQKKGEDSRILVSKQGSWLKTSSVVQSMLMQGLVMRMMNELLVFEHGIVSNPSTIRGFLTDNSAAETTFERDEVAGQLENRFNGQGHRAGLNNGRRQPQRNDHWEAVDNRVGEERSQYLQARGAAPENYTTSCSNGDRIPDGSLGSRGAAPRSVSSPHNFPDRGRPYVSQSSIQARAPSPRAFGTVRFGPGGQRIQNAQKEERPVVNPDSIAAAKLRAFAANRFAVLSEEPTSPPSIDPEPVHRPTPVASPTPAPIPQRAASAQASSSASTKPSHDFYQAGKCLNKALWYAAFPGEQCDTYYSAHPDEKQYLGKAKRQLVWDAINLAKKSDPSETKDYLDLHKERTWIVEGLMKAKRMVKEDTEEDIQAFLAAYPNHKVLFDAASVNWGTKTPDEAVETAPNAQVVPVVEQTVQPQATEHTTMAPQRASFDSNTSSSNSEDSVDTSISGTVSAAIGKLTATFYDIAGEHLGIRQFNVQAPVYANLSITSRARRFDPRDLIEGIEALAQNMVNKSHILEGVRLADDGIWEEDDEL